MPEEIYKKIFSKNLNYYMHITGKNQTDIVNDLGFNKSAVSTWCNGTRLPRMDKVEALAKYFGINRSDLIEEKKKEEVTLTPRDERDIAKDLDRIMGEIQKGNDGPLYYNGVEISEASLGLLQNAIEYALRETKKENKVKYNPNKNKK